MNPFRLEKSLVETSGRFAALRQPLRLGDKVMKNTLPRLSHSSRPSSSANQSPISHRERPSLYPDPPPRDSDVYYHDLKVLHTPDLFRSPQSHQSSIEHEHFASPKGIPPKATHRKNRSDQASNAVVILDHPGHMNKVPVRGRSGSIHLVLGAAKYSSPKNTDRYESPQEVKAPLTRRNRSNGTPKTKRVIIRGTESRPKARDQPGNRSNELSTSSTEKLISLNTSESVDEEERISLQHYIQEHFKSKGICPASTLEFYRVGKLIGKGAFGKVISAVHKLSGETVAMKTIERAYLADERHRRKVMQEVAILQRISHKRVIKVLETFESAHHLLIVMEYAGGGDLLQHVKSNGKLSEDDARHLFRQIVEGAVAIHEAGVLHRDFKLDNILLDKAKRKVKICDFGVSRIVKAGQRINEQCGTPAYIAPEIIADRGYEGFGADTWSLGVCLYAMINGMVPFKAQTLKDLHKLILTARYTMPETMSEEAKDLVSRMLQLVPSFRISLEDVLAHPWMAQESTRDVSLSYIDTSQVGEDYVDPQIIEKVQNYGFPKHFILRSLEDNEMNHATASYYLLHDTMY